MANTLRAVAGAIAPDDLGITGYTPEPRWGTEAIEALEVASQYLLSEGVRIAPF